MKFPSLSSGQRLIQLLDQLGWVTDEPGRLTRTFLSPAMRRANVLVAGWMKAAGLQVREDSTGNLIGRLEAANPAVGNDGAKAGRTVKAAALVAGPVRRGGAGRSALPKTLLLGSHLDTVRDAGRFDGPLGVLLPIVALGELCRRGVKLI